MNGYAHVPALDTVWLSWQENTYTFISFVQAGYTEALRPVTLVSDGGSAGDDTTQASYTYTVTDALTGEVYQTTASPLHNTRMTVGAMVAATGGLAKINSSGTDYELWIAYEAPDSEACSGS